MPNKTNNIQRFVSEDMHFAAFLLCQPDLTFDGIKNTEHDDTKCFASTGQDQEIDKLLLQYYNRRGSVEPRSYDEAQAKLRDLLKIEKSRRRMIIREQETHYGGRQ